MSDFEYGKADIPVKSKISHLPCGMWDKEMWDVGYLYNSGGAFTIYVVISTPQFLIFPPYIRHFTPFYAPLRTHYPPKVGYRFGGLL